MNRATAAVCTPLPWVHTPTSPCCLCSAQSLSPRCPSPLPGRYPSRATYRPLPSSEHSIGAFCNAAQPGLGGGGCVRAHEGSHQPHMAHMEGSFYLISKSIHFYMQTCHGGECEIDQRFLRSNTQLLRVFGAEVSWPPALPTPRPGAESTFIPQWRGLRGRGMAGRGGTVLIS